MKIMFICTGNICRSAMAEWLLRKKAKDQKIDVEVYSAGLETYDGWGSTEEAIEVMRKYDVDLTKHSSTFVKNSKIENMDLILCMTSYHEKILANEYKELFDKIYTFKEYVGIFDGNPSIRDPYEMGIEEYEDCAEHINQCVDLLLEKLKIKENDIDR